MCYKFNALRGSTITVSCGQDLFYYLSLRHTDKDDGIIIIK